VGIRVARFSDDLRARADGQVSSLGASLSLSSFDFGIKGPRQFGV